MNSPVAYSTCKQLASPDTPVFAIDLATYSSLQPVSHLEYQEVLQHIPYPALVVLVGGCLVAVIVGVLFESPKVCKAILFATIPLAFFSGIFIAGSWGISSYAQWLMQKHQYGQAATTLMVTQRLYSRMSEIPFAKIADAAETHSDQLQHAADYAVSQGILHHVQQHEFDKAQALADAIYTEPTQVIRSFAFVASANQALIQHDEAAALTYAMRAHAILADPVTLQVLDTVFAKYAVVAAENGATDKANSLYGQISEQWPHTRHGLLAAYLARRHVEETLSSVIDDKTLEQTIVTTQQFYARFVQRSLPMAATLPCDLAGLLEIKASAALVNQQPGIAVEALLQSERFVLNAPNISRRFPEAYRELGIVELERGSPQAAVNAFEQAHARSATKASACDLSVALNHTSMQHANNRMFDAALASLNRADQLCADNVNRSLRGGIHLAHGKHMMQAGRWNEAGTAFNKAAQIPETQWLGLSHGNSIETLSQQIMRLKYLGDLGEIPQVTGQLCAEPENGEGAFCDTIYLFNNEKYVGRALADFSEIEFAADSSTMTMLSDFDRNQRFDTWRRRTGNSDLVMYDDDDDLRPDWRLVYRNDEVVEETALSGRILLRVPSAVIGKQGMDFFSNPDVYFGVWKNDTYMGRTNTHDNSNYPTWGNEAFAIDYRYRDGLTVRFYDEDIFSDEFIDGYRFESLPTSGFMTAENQKVAFYVHVVPTDLPEGLHPSTVQEEFAQTNIFRDPSFLNEKGVLPKIIRDADSETARTEITSFAGAFVGSDVTVFTLLRNASFLTKLASAWISFDLLHEGLGGGTEVN